MMTRAALIMAMMLARHAHADSTVSIETHGVEIEVPGGWSDTNKGDLTTLRPKLYKGRAIEVLTLPAMPANQAELQKLLGDKAKIVKAGPADRQGVRMIEASATMKGDKGDVNVDMVIIPVAKGATMLMSFIGADQDPILRKANDAIILSARVAGPKMSVEFTETKTKGVGAPKDYVDAFRQFIPLLDAGYLFPRPLPVRFHDCGQVNAFYSSATHDIQVCHELFDNLRAMFKSSGMDDKKSEQMTRSTITFAFFHEFGHALVGEFGLPITGKSEDAADELAALVMIGAGKKGQQIALDTAEWFELNVKQSAGHVVSKRAYFDEHSYDEARVGNIYCMLYGADRSTYAELMKKRGMPERRLAFCLKDYPDRKNTWEKMLEPHHRRPAKK